MFGRKKRKKSAGEIAAQKIRDNPPQPEDFRTIEEYRRAEEEAIEASRLLGEIEELDRRLEKDAMPLDEARKFVEERRSGRICLSSVMCSGCVMLVLMGVLL